MWGGRVEPLEWFGRPAPSLPFLVCRFFLVSPVDVVSRAAAVCASLAGAPGANASFGRHGQTARGRPYATPARAVGGSWQRPPLARRRVGGGSAGGHAGRLGASACRYPLPWRERPHGFCPRSHATRSCPPTASPVNVPVAPFPSHDDHDSWTAAAGALAWPKSGGAGQTGGRRRCREQTKLTRLEVGGAVESERGWPPWCPSFLPPQQEVLSVGIVPMSPALAGVLSGDLVPAEAALLSAKRQYVASELLDALVCGVRQPSSACGRSSSGRPRGSWTPSARSSLHGCWRRCWSCGEKRFSATCARRPLGQRRRRRVVGGRPPQRTRRGVRVLPPPAAPCRRWCAMSLCRPWRTCLCGCWARPTSETGTGTGIAAAAAAAAEGRAPQAHGRGAAGVGGGHPLASSEEPRPAALQLLAACDVIRALLSWAMAQLPLESAATGAGTAPRAGSAGGGGGGGDAAGGAVQQLWEGTVAACLTLVLSLTRRLLYSVSPDPGHQGCLSLFHPWRTSPVIGHCPACCSWGGTRGLRAGGIFAGKAAVGVGGAVSSAGVAGWPGRATLLPSVAHPRPGVCGWLYGLPRAPGRFPLFAAGCGRLRPWVSATARRPRAHRSHAAPPFPT